jgi:dienelactone hydrolase
MLRLIASVPRQVSRLRRYRPTILLDKWNMMDTRVSPARRLGKWGMTTLIVSLLPGCVGNSPPKVDDGRVKQFAGRGYLTDDRYSIATTFSTWMDGDRAFDVAWTVPIAGKPLPVVVYLPGLGESRTSGESWRTAWAQAGYAVLSLQLLSEDKAVWSSIAARRGDFGTLARERYGKDPASARMKALAALLGELQKGHGADDALLRRLDLSKIAVAGFDIGAYTSMLVAGETPKGNAETERLPISVAAVVALSPYADFSGSALASRYQSIAIPVLSVSGDSDADTAGVVSSPSLRRAPFEYMPSRDAYLLWLTNATHSVISGSAPDAEETTATAGVRRDEGEHKSGSRREGRHGGAGRSDTNGSGDNPGLGGGRLGGYSVSPTDRALSISLIQGVTTAFLDAFVKQDGIAQEWLKKDAGRWIGERGELRRRGM